MKKLLTLLLLILSFICDAQQSFIQVNGWNASVHLPATYSATTKGYPTIIFFPGIGEIGTTASEVILNGPGAYIAQGWDGNITLPTGVVEFIVISLQPPSAYPGELSINTQIQALKSLYRIDSRHLFLTGLSMGGWCATTFVTGDPLGGPYTYASQIKAIANIEGVVPDDNSPFPQLFQNYAFAGGKLVNFEQVNDSRNMQGYTDVMNTCSPGSATHIFTNYEGGGHGSWNFFYGGQGKTPVDSFTIDGIHQNIYQWFARQSVDNIVLALNPYVRTSPQIEERFFNQTYNQLVINSTFLYPWQLYTAVGDLLQHGQFVMGNNYIDISRYPTGVYFFKYSDYYKKIVITK